MGHAATMAYLEAKERIRRMAANDPSLTEAHFHGSDGLLDDDITELLDALGRNTRLQSFKLTDMGLTDDQVSKLPAILQRHPNLQVLGVHKNKLTDDFYHKLDVIFLIHKTMKKFYM